MAEYSWEWSGSSEKLLLLKNGNDTVATIKGFNSNPGLATPTDSNGGITIGKEAASCISDDGISLTSSGAYWLELGADVSTYYAIDTSSTTIDGGVIKGSLSEYYTLSNNVITKTASVASVNFATIGGTALVLEGDGLPVGSLAGGTQISLDAGDLKVNYSSVSADNVVTITANKNVTIDTDSDGTADATVNVNTDIFSFVLSNGTDTATTLGFNTLDNAWTSSGKAAIYNKVTGEGWTSDGKTIDYTTQTNTALATISGFKDNVDIATVESDGTGSKYPVVASAQAVSVGADGMFYIARTALTSTEGATGALTLTKSNSSDTYQLAFLNTDATQTGAGGATLLDLQDDKNQAYWVTLSGGGFAYQYDTKAGWTLKDNTITYTKARSTTAGDNAPTGVMTVTGSAGLKKDGFTVPDGVASGNITIASSAFDSAKDASLSFNYASGITDTNNATVSYNLTFADNTATLASMAAAPDIKVTINGTNASITGDIDAWLSKTENTVNYYAAKNDYAIATINGLKSGAQFSVESSDSKTLILDKNDLTNTNVTLSVNSVAAGIQPYVLSLASGVDDSVLQEEKHLNTSVDASLTAVDTGKGEVSVQGTALEYYTLEGRNDGTLATHVVTYNAPETVNLAKITGLSEDAKTGTNISVKTEAGADRTIQLSQTALQSGSNVQLINSSLTSGNSHGLKLELVEGTNTVNVLGNKDSGDYWSVSGGTATYQHYKKEGWTKRTDELISYDAAGAKDVRFKVEGLNTNLVNDTGSEESSVMAAVSVSGNATNGYTAVVDTEYLAVSATNATIATVGAENSNTVTFKLKGDDGTAGKDSKADDNRYGFVNEDAANRYWSVSGSAGNYTATYMYDIGEGWSLGSDGKITYTAAQNHQTLVQISGLKGLTSSDSLAAIDGISIDSAKKTFSLDSALLGDTAISLTASDNADSLFIGSKLALADDNGGALDGTAAGDGSIGFGAGDKFWSVNGGTALYKQYTNEGWYLNDTLNATLISHTSITSAADAKGLATVSGVKSDINASDFNGITIVEPTNASTPGTITLNQYVMPATSNETVTVGVEGNYKLALESGIPTLASGSITTALHFDTVAGSATLKETRDSGWVTSTNDTLLTYHPTVDTGYATLTGLKAGDISANIGFDSKDSLISVKEGALTSKNVTLESSEYTLQMVDSLGNKDSDSMFGFGNETKVWVFDKDTVTTAYYASKTDEGWSLGSDNKSIVYTSGDWDTSKSATNAFADSTYTSLAAISNLKSGVTADDLKSISISSRNVVSIHPSLASASTESSLQTAISDDYTLKLLGDEGTGDDATKGDGMVGFKVGNAYWQVSTVDGGYKAVYYQDKAAGWSIDSNNKISYTGLQQATLATIENLKGLTVTAEGDKTQTTLAGVTVDGKNFKLANTALGTLAVSLTQGEDLGGNATTYKLVLAGDTGSTVDGDGTKKGDGAVGFIAAPNKWRFDTTDSLAVYEYEVGEGWSVSSDTLISYTAASDHDSTDAIYAKGLATIANLNPSLTVEDGAIAGITVSGNTISLAQEVLGASVTTSGGAASLISATAGTYKLKLADDTGGEKDGTKAGDNKIGFIDTDKYWAAANSSITYQYDTSAGWVLDTTNNVVTYTQAKSQASTTADPTVIFTITGLASNVAASGGQIAGIALGSDKKTITISDKDLFTSLAADASDATVNLAPGTGVATGAYVLALGSDLATAPTYAKTTGVTVDSGKATIGGTVNDYFTLAKDKTSITHTASKTDQALAIVGNLNGTVTSGVSLDSVSGGNGDKTVIVLAKGALDSMNVKLTKESISGVPSYTFNFATGASDSVFTTANTADGTVGSSISSVSGGKAAITGQTKAYYTIDNTKGEVVYHKPENVTLATVMGLTTNSIAADDVQYGNGIVSIKAGALGQGRVYIAPNNSLEDVTGLSLQLVDSVGAALPSHGFDGSGAGSKWVYSGTTATYKKVTGEGWSVVGGAIEYTPAEVDVDAVITGLKAGMLNSSNVSLGTGTDSQTIQISTDALTNKSVVLTAKPGYKLALVENATSKTLVGGTVGSAEWFVDSDGTAKYQVDTSASWQLNDSGDIITYTAEKTGNTANVLAEITGLKSGITAADLEYGVSVDASNGKFILSNNLLGTGDIKLTDTDDTDSKDYKLALGSDVAQTADVVNYWTTSGTTATYKKDSSAYYTLDSLGTGISYNAAVTGESIVKLKNLKKGVTATSVDGKPAVIEGITVAKEATAGTKDSGVIVVSANVLGTETADSKLFQLATNADKDAYVLTLDNDIATTAASLRAWTYGATSELKLGNNAYYSVVGGDSIKYTAETGTGTATKPTTLVKITGLSKNTAEGDVVETTEPTKDSSSGKVTAKGVITLSENAFNNAKVSLSTGKDSYVLAFAESLKPQISNEKWTLNKTTATYKGDKSAGYTLSTKGDSITYSKAQSGATLLTISGLPKDITEAEFKDGIKLGEAEDGVIPVTIAASILKRVTGKVTLKGTGYKFVLPDAEEGFYTEDSTIVKTDNGADVWTISGTTATYKRVVPAYYKLTNDTTISYVKEATAKVYDTSTKKNVDQVYATVGGLAKGLVVENGKIKDKAGGTQVITVTTEPSDSTPGTITLAEAAYGTSSKITVTNKVKSYTPTLKEATKPAPDQAMWTISGTTATYKSACTTEGWGDPVKDAKKNVYTVSKTAANTSKSVNTVVTVSGLVKGLKVSADGNVTDANGNQVITGTLDLSSDKKSASGSLTIDRAALGTTNVTIKNATGGTVTLTDPGITSDAVGEIWSLSGTTLTISRGKTVGYTLDASGKIVYSAAKAATKLVTIKGLKKGLALNSEGTIDGINFGADGTVTVDQRVLGTSSVTLSGTGYKLALDTTSENNKAPTSTNTTMWSVSGTKATLKNATTEGYVLSGNTIKYNKLAAGKASTDTLAVVDGLKKGLKVNADGTIDGITVDVDNNKITLDAKVLNDKTVTLTNKNVSNYTLKAGNGVNKSEVGEEGSAWKVSGTTATLYETVGKGYSGDNTNTLTYNNGTTPDTNKQLATVSNLKKSLKVNADGTIDGITVKKDGADSTITLDNRVLNGKDVTITDLATGSDETYNDGITYKLDLDYTDTKNKVTKAVQGYKYTISGNKVTIKVFTPAGYTVDGSGNVVYSSAVLGTTVATIEGVVSGLKANSDGTLTGIDASGLTYDPTANKVSGTLKLDKEVLGSTDISITNATDNSVKLALAAGIIDGTATKSWYIKDGASVLTVTTKKGYSANADGSKISYTASDTEKVSLIGLTNTTDVTVDTDKKIVTVPTSALGSATQVELTGGDYTLVLQDQTSNETWEQVNDTTARYVVNISAGGYGCDGTRIIKNTTNATKTIVLATLTGLPESLSMSTGLGGIVGDVDSDGYRTITLPPTALSGTSNITLSGSGYKLAVNDAKTPQPTTSEQWSFDSSKGTATYAKGTTEGYTVSADGKTATYSAFKTSGTPVATVTGLNKNLTTSDIQTAFGTNNKQLKINNDMVAETGIKVTGTGYTLALDTTTSGKKVPTSSSSTTPKWAVSNNTATFKLVNNAYYKLNGKANEITYMPEADANGGTIVKLEGLASGLTVDKDGSIDGITIDFNDFISGNLAVVLGKNVFAGKDVSLTSDVYENNNIKLVLEDDVPAPESTEPQWTVSGTTAMLKENSTEGYVSKSAKVIEHVAAKSGTTLATLTNLKSGLKADEDGYIEGITLDTSTNVITLSNDVLGTSKISLSGSGYTLDLDRDNVVDDEDTEVTDPEASWKVSGTTATYARYTPAYYKLNGNAIEYVKESSIGSAIASITGVNNFDADSMFDGTNKVTLYAENLSNNVKIFGTGFTLELGGDVDSAELDDDSVEWSMSGSNATLKGNVSAGYALNATSTEVTYSNKDVTKTFATVNGVKETPEIALTDTNNKEITLEGENLESAVSISSGEGYIFNFNAYSDGSISGSTGNDSISVDSNGLTINLGKGDDYIDLASTTTDNTKADTIVYASGDGNDVIAHFDLANDKLKVTGVKLTNSNVKYDSSNTVIKIGSGSIKLEGVNGTATAINIVDGNGNEYTIKGSAADLLDSDNFLTAGNSSLEDLVQPVTAIGTLDESLTDPQDLKTLTKQSNLVAYLNSRKK